MWRLWPGEGRGAERGGGEGERPRAGRHARPRRPLRPSVSPERQAESARPRELSDTLMV